MVSSATPPWSSAKLGEVCVFRRGFSWNKSQERREAGHGRVPVIRIPNIKNVLELDDLMYIDSVRPEDVARYQVGKGWCLLVGSNGNPNRVGNCVIIRSEVEALFASFLLGVRPCDDKLVDPEFLFYTLSSEFVQRKITRNVQGSTGLKNLNVAALKEVEVSWPALAEQRKIAAILAAIDETIEKSVGVLGQLRVIRPYLCDELLSGPTEEAGVGGSNGWSIATIGALCSLSSGKGFGPQDWARSGMPIIRIQNLNGSTEFNYFDGVPEPRWIVEPGDLLYAWAGSRGASFGPHIWQGPRGVLNQHIHKIAPSVRVTKRFLYYVLLRITRSLERRAHGFKQTLVHLRKSELTDYRVPIPSPQEQERIVDVLSALDKRIETEEVYLSALRAVKESLATALLSGQIRVTPDEATP